MPIYVPRELIHAAGMLPVGIMGAGERLEIIRGDAYFQSYICHIPRSTIELALSRRLDALDGMLFPSICDVIRNLSGMWSHAVSRNATSATWICRRILSPEQAGVYWRRELESTARGFCAAERPSDRRRCPAAQHRRIQRKSLRHSRAISRPQPSAVGLPDLRGVRAVLRAGNVLPPEEHTALLREYLRLAPLETDRRDRDQSRVVLVGMFCEQPPLGLLLTLERAGCWVVDDDLLLGLRWITGEIPCDWRSIASPGRRLPYPERRDCRTLPARGQHGRCTRRIGPAQSRRRGHLLRAQFLRSRSAGAAHARRQARHAKAFPHTQFKYSEDTGQFAVIREQAGTFSDSIRLWSQA